jgi:DNA-binding transcriptional MerR regulator
LEDFDEANNDLNRLNAESDEKIDTLEQRIRTLDETHREELNAKLRKIKDKIEERKRLTYDDLKNKYNL